MKKLAIILMLLAQASYAQEDTLDLFGCLEAVEEHHPTTEQKPVIHQQTQLKLKNLRSKWYPSLDVNAQASYQSDVVQIDMDLPFDADFPSPSRDQYQATLDVKQMIYDGGFTKASRETEKVGERLQKQSVEVDLYRIKDQVMEVYFGILLLHKRQAILESTAKKMGTIEQINVTPIRKYQFIVGKLLPFLVIALFELAFGLFLGRMIFDVPVVGNLGLLFGFTLVYLLVILGFGLFLSVISESQQQVMFVTFFFMLVFILMSGIFTPTESMPEWAKKVNVINPIAYLMKVIRMILLKGSGFMDILTEFYSLLIYAVLSLGLAVWRYRKTV